MTYQCIFHLHYQRYCTYYVNTVNNIIHQCVFICINISIILSLLSALMVASVHHCIIYIYTAVFTTNLRSHQCTYNRFTVTSMYLQSVYGLIGMSLSLVGAAKSIIFVATNTCLSRQKFCRDKNDTCGSSRR